MDDDVQLFCSEICYWSLLFVCLLLLDFFSGLFPFCPSPLFLHSTVCHLDGGIRSSFLAWSWGKFFLGKWVSWGDLLIIKGILVL
jgi:hypothetical protein